MPELPEVEVIVNELRPKLVGRRITGVHTDWPKYFRLPQSESEFGARIIGKKIVAVDRRAKNVLIHLTESHLLLIHQKISGRLLIGNWERSSKREADKTQHSLWQPVRSDGDAATAPGRFIHLVFDLDDGRQLGLSDLRKFAKVLCGKEETILNLPEIRRLGPEPLDPRFTFAAFQRLFDGRKGRIKQTLMNPNFIAGIGNIYSDEILYVAGIQPLSRISHLLEPQLRLLYHSVKRVLRRAVKLRGTGVGGPPGAESRYDRVRLVYQREECPHGHAIKRIKLGGRSARFCPVEQKLF